MPEVEAPEIELDEDAPRFRRRLALIVVLITLFGAVVAYLHEQNSNLEDNAAREAQIQAIQGFGQQVSSATETNFDYQVFVQLQLLQRRQLVAQSRQRSTDSDLATAYGADATRWGALNAAMSDGAPEQSDDDVNTVAAKLQVAPDEARLTQQVFAGKANDYGNKADAYVALLTVLAVGLFLIGLSLTVSGRGRYLLAIPGVAVAIICVGWAVVITTGSVTKISPNAIQLTAQGQQKEIAGDYKGAISDYKSAVADSPSFGPAFSRLSDAEFEAGITNDVGNQFESISTTDATKRAITAGEKAISLGENNPSLLSSVGFYHFEVGDYDRAEQLSQQALQGNDQIAPLIFNLGVAQAAKNEKSAARQTYQQGIDVLAKENNGTLRQEIASAALTDLEIANEKASSSAKDLITELKGKLVDAEFKTGTDGSDATADQVKVSTTQFKLQATYDTSNLDDGSVVANVWYYRPLNSSEPFVQQFNLDSTSEVSDDAVTTDLTQSDDCLQGGDYRVEVFAGSKLIGSNDDDPFALQDSPLGDLMVDGGESVGVQLCRPTDWNDTSPSDDSTLSYADPTDASQSIFLYSFPFGSSTLPSEELIQEALQVQETLDGLTNVAPVSDGLQLEGRSTDNQDFPLATDSIVGDTKNGNRERVTVSVDQDRVVRVVVLTAGNDDDLGVLSSEVISSIRYLDLQPPPTGQGG